MATAAVARKVSRTQANKISKTAPPNADQLADQLASELVIADSKGKRRELSPEQQKLESMKAINTASQALSATIHSGWKASRHAAPAAGNALTKEARDTKELSAQVWRSVAEVEKHLRLLRKWNVDGEPIILDVERAAVSILGKFVVLELFDVALQLLQSTHANICIFLNVSSSHLVMVPIVDSGRTLQDDSVILNLLSSYLTHSLVILVNLIQSPAKVASTSNLYSLDAFATLLLEESGTLLSWVPKISANGIVSTKHVDSQLTRVYSALTKAIAAEKTSLQAVFTLRMYGLSCLACATVGTVDPNTLWDQAIRFGGSWIRSLSGQPSSSTSSLAPLPEQEEEAAATICKVFGIFVDTLRDRPTWGQLVDGKGWMSFCEYWVAVAKRCGNITLLNRIAGLMRNPNLGLIEETPPPVGINTQQRSRAEDDDRMIVDEPQDWTVHSARLSVSLAQMTASFEQNKLAEIPESQLKDLLNQLKYPVTIKLLVSKEGLTDEDKRAQGKLDRAIERLRRATLKHLEALQQSSNIDEVHLCRDILTTIITVFEAILTKTRHNDFTTRFLDAVFVLARSSLVPSDAQTHSTSYDLLQRANVALFSLPPTQTELENDLDIANYLRCISGAWYNLAGSLFQAGRYGATVPFLKESCEIGVMALEEREKQRTRASTDAAEVDSDDRNAEAFKQLEESLYRRWELLAMCHSKVGDRKATVEAFGSSLLSFPFSSTKFVSLVTHHPLYEVFHKSEATRPVVTILNKLTYLATCDLLLPPKDVSLKRHTKALGKPIAGALIEQQIVCLEKFQWKDVVKDVVKGLLSDALEIYDPMEMPLRRARVLLKYLDFEYYASMNDHRGASTKEMAREVERLTTVMDFSLDRPLSPYALQYRVSGHIYSALYLHRLGSNPNSNPGIDISNSDSSQIPKIIESACDLLWTHLFADKCESLEETPAPAAGKSGNARGRGKAAQASTTTTGSGRRGAAAKADSTSGPSSGTRSTRSKAGTTPAQNVETPRLRSGRKGAAATPSETEEPTKPVTKTAPVEVAKLLVAFEGIDKFIELLLLASRVMGFLGLMVQRLRILDLVRRLCEQYLGMSSEGYVLTSIELAQEYGKAGKTHRATKILGQVMEVVKSGKMNEEVGALFYLRFAETMALAEDIDNSSALYQVAISTAESISPEDKTAPTMERIHARVGRLERAAVAAQVVSFIQVSKENATRSIDGLLQSLRLWNRAVDSLARLNAPPASNKAAGGGNPFQVTSYPESPAPPNGKSGSPANYRQLNSNLEWRVIEGLFNTLHALSYCYFIRGSIREAEYFAIQAQELAESIGAPALLSRALARRGELAMLKGNLEESQESLAKAGQALLSYPGASTEGGMGEVEGEDGAGDAMKPTGIDVAEIRRLWAAFKDRTEQGQDAEVLYGETKDMLVRLDDAVKEFDHVTFGPRKSSIGISLKEILAPEKLAVVLGELILILSKNGGDYSVLLQSLLALPETSLTKTEESALLSQLGVQNVYAHFRSDMFLSSIAESTIALPMGMSTKPNASTATPSNQIILGALDEAEKLSWEALSILSAKGEVAKVRRAAISLALIKAFQTALGKTDVGGEAETARLAAGLLDASTNITLRREMLEAIQRKFTGWDNGGSGVDDLQWPSIDAQGNLLPQISSTTTSGGKISSQKSNLKALRLNVDGDAMNADDADALNAPDSKIRQHWEAVRERYEKRLLDPVGGYEGPVNEDEAGPDEVAPTRAPGCEQLPEQWTVIHLNITSDKCNLFVSRQQGGPLGGNPVIFCVPLIGRRDTGAGDADDVLTFDDAIIEFKEIVRLSNEGTKRAVNIKADDKEGRAEWWKERADLDKRMKELLDNVELCWLGGFKTILSPRLSITASELLPDLRTQLEKLFQRHLRQQEKQPKQQKRATSKGHSRSNSQTRSPTSQLTFDDNLIRCFASLSPKAPDEEVEDLIYFVLDLYQFHGISVAIAEVDTIQAVLDVRTILEDFNGKVNRKKKQQLPSKFSSDGTGEHIFLVLDKDVQGLPWESIPILRGRSVSRIPNMDFLLDRVEYVKRMQPSPVFSPSGLKVDAKKGYYVLNPSGDLSKTEERFKEWAGGMKKIGWDGTIGKPPSEQQMLDALRNRSIVVYFGHGGAEQYVRTHKIRNLPSCAVTMLWGCSSGILREAGDFDRTGTANGYMLAGCPTLVANLWDVTDRDIDKFSQSVFDQLRLIPGEIQGTTRWGKSIVPHVKMTVTTAVAQSREVCKLKYLTGAAPVVYGIPFYL